MSQTLSDVEAVPPAGSGLGSSSGSSGGIAAYKACELLRLLHRVRPRRDRRADRGRAAVRRRAHLGRAVRQAGRTPSVWDDVHQVPHVRIGQSADLVVVAPATADLLARAAHGLADDLLTTTLLTARCPVVFAPAMHTEMWEHPATTANVATLRERGVVVIEPAEGRLTGADTGRAGCPSRRRSSRSASTCSSRGAARAPTWPAATSWSPPAAPASRSTRSASSATAPRAGRATRWPGRRPPAAPR